MSIYTKRFAKGPSWKKRASDACSKYIRLRDAIEFAKRTGIGLNLPVGELVGECCTCPRILPWKRMHAGHYFSRGLAGGSGTYFDERNIHLQCALCNAFEQGNPRAYDEFMLRKYGQTVIDELRIKHHGCSRKTSGDYMALEKLFKELYEELVRNWNGGNGHEEGNTQNSRRTESSKQ